MKALSLLFSCVIVSIGAAEEYLRIGSEKQVFVGPWTEDGRDGYLVESMTNVAMTVNEARVTGERLLVVDKPWEGSTNKEPQFDVRQFVLKDGDTFRMYYSALPTYPNYWEVPNGRILCYAESTDGIHWTKPNLGLCTWDGSKENNIILPHDDLDILCSEYEGATVFIDPVAASKDEKYKMLVKMTPAPMKFYKNHRRLPKGQYAFVSADGIRWKLKSPRKVNPAASDTQLSVFWDERIAKYVAYTRMKPYYPDRKIRIRQVGRMVSDDFVHWGKETSVLAPDKSDWEGSPPKLLRVSIYGGNISKYTESPNIYLALPSLFYHWKYDRKRTYTKRKDPSKGNEEREEPKGKVSYHVAPATMDVQLATSRDGIHWNRSPQRRPFIRLGPEGSFWSKVIFPGADFIRVKDELWIYFGALDVSHSEERASVNGARGRAVLRLDGFISADAAYTGGELTTKPLIFSGSKLQLNVDTSAGGVVKMEIQDKDGAPINVFTEAVADEINGNYIRIFARWQGSTDVSSLAGKPVRLRFVMRDAKLYSFQFLP